MRQVHKRNGLCSYKGQITSESKVHLSRTAVLSQIATMQRITLSCSVRQSSTIARMRKALLCSGKQWNALEIARSTQFSSSPDADVDDLEEYSRRFATARAPSEINSCGARICSFCRIDVQLETNELNRGDAKQ